MDRSGHVSQTYKKNMKKIARINSTPQVIQACICIIRSILQVTQRVPPTCTIKHISRTRRDHVQCGMHRGRVGPGGKKKWVAQRSHGGKKGAAVMPEAVGGGTCGNAFY